MSYRVLSLKGKIVLITGASSGIGKATAIRFAEEKSDLILVARRSDRLQALKASLQGQHEVKVHIVTMDLQDIRAVESLVEGLPDDFREVDILVNNAGLALGKGPAHTTETGDIATMLDTNCKAVAILTRDVAAGMVKRNYGHIINISSIASTDHYAGGSIYCGTKAFIAAFTDSCRHDFVGTNIRVSAISPGAVQTEFSNVRFKGNDSAADAVYEGIIPLTAEDIADQVLYVATRPTHVQISDVVSYATFQASATNIARVLKK